MTEGIISRVLGRLHRHSLTADQSKQSRPASNLNGKTVQAESPDESRVNADTRHTSGALPLQRPARVRLNSVKTGEPGTRQRKNSIRNGSAAQPANAITIGKNRSISVPDSAFQNEERMLLKHELETDGNMEAAISAVLMAAASHSERDLSTNLRDNYDSIVNPSQEKLSAAPKEVVKPTALMGGEHPDVLDGIMPPTSQPRPRSLAKHDWQRPAFSSSPERGKASGPNSEATSTKNTTMAQSVAISIDDIDVEIDSIVKEFDHKGTAGISKPGIEGELDQLLKAVESETARGPDPRSLDEVELDRSINEAEESLVHKPPELERELEDARKDVEDELKPRRPLPRRQRVRAMESPERRGPVRRGPVRQAPPTATSPKTPQN
jgi:hypothetical protein